MVRTIGVIAIAAMAAVFGGRAGAAQAGAESALTDATLVGNWVINDGKCTDAAAEFLVFHQNGAVVSLHDGQADAVGFWKIDAGKIYLDVLAPPSRLDEKLKDIKGLFSFGITIAPYDVTPDAFRGVGILDDQVRYGRFTRCKA